MNTWKVILATVLIFGTGVVTGGLLVRQSQRQFWRQLPPAYMQHQAARSPAPTPPATRLEFLRKAERELNLTPDQKRQVDAVLADGQERMRRLMDPIAPKIREEVNRTRDDFRAILTPDQRARMDELQKQQRTRDQKRRADEPRKRD